MKRSIHSSICRMSQQIHQSTDSSLPHKRHKPGSPATCISYNSPLGCCYNQSCRHKHEYDGDVIATCKTINFAHDDHSLVSRFKVSLIGTYCVLHSNDSTQSYHNTIQYYATQLTIPGIPPRLGIPQLDTQFNETNDYVNETINSLLPILMTIKYNNHSLSKYNFVTYRNSLNYIVNDNDQYRIHIQRIGNTIFLLPCKSHKQHIYQSYNRGAAGYRFESICKQNNNNNTDRDSEYCHVNEVHIGEHKLAVAAEIDGVMNESIQHLTPFTRTNHQQSTPNTHNPSTGDSINNNVTSNTSSIDPYYIELKTNASGRPWNKQRFNQVLTQSYLADIPYVLLANLTSQPQQSTSKPSLRTMTVNSLQYIDVKHEMNEYEQSSRLQQANYILQFISNNTQSDHIYRLHRINNNGNIVYELAEFNHNTDQYRFIQQCDLIDVQRWRDRIWNRQKPTQTVEPNRSINQ